MSCCDQSNKQPEDNASKTQEIVRQYYGKQLQTTEDLQTGACCLIDSKMPTHISQALAEVHEEVSKKYYGCGRVIPEALEGCYVLDLGCGSGRDCFAVSKLVGAAGHVVGIDMTDEQLAVANKYVEYHTEKFGYAQPNVDFRFGYIENLKEAGLDSDTFDVVISNCVVNLSVDKKAVLTEVHRVMREGGEFYFSDVYTDTYLSDAIKSDPVLYGECIAGALHWRQLHDLAREIGFAHPRLVTAKMVDVDKFQEVLGDAKFVSVTYRIFRLPQTKQPASRVTYQGGLSGCEEQFEFDHQLTFMKDKEVVVDSELASLLAGSRFKSSFQFQVVSEGTPCGCTAEEEPLDPFVIANDKPCTKGGSCCN